MLIEVTLTDGSNFTGTEIFSNLYYTISYSSQPVSADIYGMRLTVLGFDETAACNTGSPKSARMRLSVWCSEATGFTRSPIDPGEA